MVDYTVLGEDQGVETNAAPDALIAADAEQSGLFKGSPSLLNVGHEIQAIPTTEPTLKVMQQDEIPFADVEVAEAPKVMQQDEIPFAELEAAEAPKVMQQDEIPFAELEAATGSDAPMQQDAPPTLAAHGTPPSWGAAEAPKVMQQDEIPFAELEAATGSDAPMQQDAPPTLAAPDELAALDGALGDPDAEDRPSDDTTEVSEGGSVFDTEMQSSMLWPADSYADYAPIDHAPWHQSEGGSADDTDGPSFDAMASAFTADDTTADEPADPLAVSDPTMLAIDQTLDAGLIQGSAEYREQDGWASAETARCDDGENDQFDTWADAIADARDSIW